MLFFISAFLILNRFVPFSICERLIISSCDSFSLFFIDIFSMLNIGDSRKSVIAVIISIISDTFINAFFTLFICLACFSVICGLCLFSLSFSSLLACFIISFFLLFFAFLYCFFSFSIAFLLTGGNSFAPINFSSVRTSIV